jgi:hypothetical protein
MGNLSGGNNMKKTAVVLSVLVLFAGSVFAMQPEIIGGIRDGLALGIMADAPVARNAGVRFGIEANTGGQPIIAFFGGKFFLTNTGGSPMYFGLGAVAYTGEKDKTDVGASLSVIFNRAFNINPLFVEFGIDVADSARVQAQAGYKIY